MADNPLDTSKFDINSEKQDRFSQFTNLITALKKQLSRIRSAFNKQSETFDTKLDILSKTDQSHFQTLTNRELDEGLAMLRRINNRLTSHTISENVESSLLKSDFDIDSVFIVFKVNNPVTHKFYSNDKAELFLDEQFNAIQDLKYIRSALMELVRQTNEENKSFIQSKIELYDSKLTSNLKQFRNEIDDFKELFTKRFTELTEQTNITNAQSLEKYENDAATKIEKLNILVGKGENLHHYLSGKSLSGFFADRANAEAKSAEFWTILTGGFAGLTFLSLIAVFVYQIWFPSDKQDVNIQFLTTKVLITATLGLIAKWCSKRANRHINEEAKYHRLQINTSTVEPFISQLKPETRDEILKAVALKTFTETGAESNTAVEFETPSIVDAVKAALVPKAEK